MRNKVTSVSARLFESLHIGDMFIAHDLVWTKTSNSAATELWSYYNICSFTLSPSDAVVIPLYKDFPNLSSVIKSDGSEHLKRSNLLNLMTESDRSIMNTAEALEVFYEFEFYDKLCDDGISSVTYNIGCKYLDGKLQEIKKNCESKSYDHSFIVEFVDSVKSRLRTSDIERDSFFDLLHRNWSVSAIVEHYKSSSYHQ